MKAYLVLLCIFLASCATLTLDKASGLRKGITREEAKLTLKTVPKITIDLRDSIIVEVYDMASGGYNALYYVSYKQDKVLYWGYPHEYAREKDPLLNRVGKETTESVNAMKAQRTESRNN